MGPDSYRMLGYGIITKEIQLFTTVGAPIHREILPGPLADQVAIAYEARPQFLMLRLAIDDASLRDEWQLSSLPYEAIDGSVAERKALQISLDESNLSKKMGAAINVAHDRWATIHEAFKQRVFNVNYISIVLPHLEMLPKENAPHHSQSSQ